MKAILSKTLMAGLLLSAATLRAQVIEPTAGQSLTITEDVTLNAGKALRVADTVLLKTSVASAGNLFLGLQAGAANPATAINNTFLGTATGLRTTGSANTFVGYSAGRSNTTGQFNTFIGVRAGLSNTTGNSNFIMGTNAGTSNTSGTANFFLGDNAGGANSTGGFNVFLGANAGASNTVGSNNTAIGFEANVGSGGLVNATAIGFRAVASANNSVVLGNGANVGIGTSAPSSKLHVVSGAAGQSGLRLENLTSAAVSTVNASKFLTVDGTGNVILANYAGSGRLGVTPESENLWQYQNGYLQSTKSVPLVIGANVAKLPAGYQLYVQDGLLTEKVKVAVRNTSEWSDHVFAKNYPLQSLTEVSRYIQIYKHLPGIPSAQEMIAQGNDLHQTDARLLEKIEELTLYSIRLEAALKASNREHQQEMRALKEKQVRLERMLLRAVRQK